ncbi:MAG: KdsC family phosphatase [Steroidobacterales bacterium]
MRGKSTPLRLIRLLILDVDGVLTDGRLRYGAGGEIEKVFHVRDGYGIKAVQALGIIVAVVSGRSSEAVAQRCRELGIDELHQGVNDKSVSLQALLARHGLEPAQCACVGDDLPDLPLLRAVGLGVAVRDAHPGACAAAHRRTRLTGGAGAVREVCDWLLAAHERHPKHRRRAQ